MNVNGKPEPEREDEVTEAGENEAMKQELKERGFSDESIAKVEKGLEDAKVSKIIPFAKVEFEPEFQEFPKMARLSREVVITEKIDGTNALIWVSEDGKTLRAGSRTRWITPEDDNYGFAKWVQANEEALLKLGPGYHYGEWYGLGIQRGYGLPTKRFALFNTYRWSDASKRPACCEVVPVLFQGNFSTETVRECIELLKTTGSKVNSKFPNPEGVVVYHTAARIYLKKTIEKDAEPKKMLPAFRNVHTSDSDLGNS